jgi:NADPH-dependent curcumin reductase CurA|tara:strand:+ start:911 stop:1987 length:1077 start_codon:yes stop_codon:yes gene_type:complete
VGQRQRQQSLAEGNKMPELVNRQWLLAKRPVGRPQNGDFEYREVHIPIPGEGEVLLRIIYALIDPAQRGWMDAVGNYFDPSPLGEPMRSGIIAKVVKSNSDLHPVGQYVSGLGGWEDYTVVPEGSVDIIPYDGSQELGAFSHLLGTKGATAYFGLLEICGLKEGDQVLVSSAAGAVGSLVGQFARIKGCRVVGIARGPEKCSWITEELGFDAAIDYGATGDLSAAIAEQFPDGLDVYFDNVGGEMLEAAIDNLALHARIAICGMISEYNQSDAPGPGNMWNLLVKRARIEGFLVSDFRPRYQEARAAIDSWIKEGRLKYKLDEREGFDILPKTLNCLFDGDHDGRLLVKLVKEVDTVI